MTGNNAQRALGATITRLADHQAKATTVTRDTLPDWQIEWANNRARHDRRPTTIWHWLGCVGLIAIAVVYAAAV